MPIVNDQFIPAECAAFGKKRFNKKNIMVWFPVDKQHTSTGIL